MIGRRELLQGGLLALAAGWPRAALAAAKPSLRSRRADEAAAAILREVMGNMPLPALGAAAIRNESLVFSAAAGVRTIGGGAARLQDRWHIGSVTKPMTATLIGVLVEEGRLGWSDKVAERLPCPDVHEAYKDATLLDLLSHRAGLPENIGPEAFERFYADRRPIAAQRRDWACLALAEPPIVAGRGRFSYSNNGYIVAGAIAEARTGRRWEDLMRTRIFRPLKLRSAGFGPPPAGLFGHEKDAEGPPRAVPRVLRGDNPAALGPAGTAHMTVADLARFGYEHVRMAQGRSTLLKPDTAQNLHEGGGADYSFGWHRQDFRGSPLLLHTGSNGHWFALLMVAPRSDWSLAVAANGGRSLGGEQAVMTAAGRLAALASA